jgi:hypothetical protein
MCMIGHPGSAQRWEEFDSSASALARQAWYAAHGDPYWHLLYDCCDGTQVGVLPAGQVAAQAGDPREGPPGAAVAARWVTQNPAVAGVPLMPRNAATVPGIVSYGCV